MNAVSRPCPERELLLHGLADGELDAANALMMEDHLQGCGGCAAAYGEILRHKELLSGEVVRFRAPAALRGRLLAAIAAQDATEAAASNVSDSSPRAVRTVAWRSPLRWAGAALPGLALAASLLLFVGSWNQGPSLSDELVAGHVRSLLVSHLTDVASSDQHTVKPWFLGKLDFAPPVIDLAKRDFPLIGGRLDYLRGHVVPALVYKRQGHIINLFVWPAGKMERAVDTSEGYHIVSWTRDGFNYAAVSDLNLPELRDFQRALIDTLS